MKLNDIFREVSRFLHYIHFVLYSGKLITFGTVYHITELEMLEVTICFKCSFYTVWITFGQCRAEEEFEAWAFIVILFISVLLTNVVGIL